MWRNLEGENYSEKSLEMVTAWQALSGMLPSTRGMYESRFEKRGQESLVAINCGMMSLKVRLIKCRTFIIFSELCYLGM